MKRRGVTSNACNYMKESNVKEVPAHLGKDKTMEKAKASGFQGSGQTARAHQDTNTLWAEKLLCIMVDTYY